jgi:tetratricopeptide (TPR) repeat protein
MRYPTSTANLILTAILLAVACSNASLAGEPENLLLNGGAEIGKDDLPSVWSAACVPADGLKMWRDTTTPYAGKACLAISNEHTYDQPVSNNWVQTLQAVPRGKTVRLIAHIRTENADAANVCIQCWAKDGKSMLAFGSTPVIRGDNDWSLVQTEAILVPEETASVVIRAALTGRGKAFYDDVMLETISPEKPPNTDVGLSKAVSGRILEALPVQKDCMVLSYMPDWAHGTVDNLAVGNHDGGVRTFVALPSISEKYLGRTDLKFVLAMYSRSTISHAPPGVLGVYRVTENWNESISWKTMPKVASDPDATFPFAEGKGWKFFDVSSLVRGNPETPKDENRGYGLMLRFTSETRSMKDKDFADYQFVSREGEGRWLEYRPVLLVVDPTRTSQATSASKPSTEEREDSSEIFLPKSRIDALLNVPDAELQKTTQEHPLTDGDFMEMNTLGRQYRSAGRPEDARRVFQRAASLAGAGPWYAMIRNNLAYLEIEAGRLDDAEAILRDVMKTPVPESMISDWRTTVHVLFVAPEYMAKILQKRGQIEEADRVLANSGDTAYELAKKHPDVNYLPSYVASAYYFRVLLLIETESGSAARARQLAEECKARVPDYKGYGDYNSIISWVEEYERRLHKAGKDPESRPSSQGKQGAIIPEQSYRQVAWPSLLGRVPGGGMPS